MFSKLHNRLGTAGLVVAVVALVAALSGGAYAASGGLTGKQKKEVKKIAKAEAKKVAKKGKAGPEGKQGPAGSQGPAGPAGPKGDAGATGATGPQGPQGPQGPTGPQGPAGPSCPTGACFLPAEATETGVWGDPVGGVAGVHNYPISFALPLEAAPEPVLVEWEEEEVEGECPGRGTDGNEPMAEPGFLCVYVMTEENNVSASPSPSFKGEFVNSGGEWEVANGASAVGAYLNTLCSGICEFAGTWAVTAP